MNKIFAILPAILILSSCSFFKSDQDKLKDAIKDYQVNLPLQLGEGMTLVRVEYSKGTNAIVFESEIDGMYKLSDREKNQLRKETRDMLKHSFVGEEGSDMYKVFDNVRPDIRFLIRNTDSGRILFDETFLANEYL